VDPRLRSLTYQVAVGLGGALAEKTDSGYQLRDSGTTEDLLAVWAERERPSVPFVAVGRNATIRVSHGFEEAWKAPTVDADTSADLRGVTYAGFPQEFGLAVGDSGTVLVGTSLGTLWQRADAPTTQRLNAVAIDGEGRATVVGDEGTILRTLDKGLSWDVVESPLTENLLSILVRSHLLDPSAEDPQYIHFGYIVGASGTFLYSSNGTDWEEIETAVTEDLRQVTYLLATEAGPEVPLILGETRLYTWEPGEPQLRLKSELRRPIFSVGQYLSRIVALVDRGKVLRFTEPYVCELPRD